MTERWWRISTYNEAPRFAFGTEEEAFRYSCILDMRGGRPEQVYHYTAITDPAELEWLDDGNSTAAFRLDEELQCIADEQAKDNNQ